MRARGPRRFEVRDAVCDTLDVLPRFEQARLLAADHQSKEHRGGYPVRLIDRMARWGKTREWRFDDEGNGWPFEVRA